MSPRVAVVWVITCLIWSTVWLFIKLGVRDVPPVTFAAGRLLIAILVMVPVTLAMKTPRPATWREWRLIAGTGVVLLGFNYALLNWGLQHISSGLTAVLQSATPAFALIFAHLLLREEPMTARKVTGLALGMLGITIIFWDQLHFGGRALAGSISVTAGAGCVAFAYVMVRRGGSKLHPSVITTGQMIAAFVPLTIFAAMVEGNPLAVRWTTTAVTSAVYLALLGSVVAAWLNYWLLSRVGAVNLLVMGLVEPVIAILLGAWFLDESLNMRALIGGAVILFSVILTMKQEEKVPEAAPSATAPSRQ